MSDDPRFTGYWAAIRADLNKQTVDAVIRLADNEQADLRAEVERLTDENNRLATLLGRRMTGKEIGETLSRMIESGDLLIPPEGSPMLTEEQVRARLGLS